jgi:iron(II)-dependent oxidoreductase
MNQQERKEGLLKNLQDVRQRTLDLMGAVPLDYWKKRVHGFYSPIGWHFGHVGRTEEFWACNQAMGEEVLDDFLTFLYHDCPENPKDNRVQIPGPEGTVEYLARTRKRAAEALHRADLNAKNSLLADGFAWDFAYQHECQHQETIIEMMHLIRKFTNDLSEWEDAPEAKWEKPDKSDFIKIKGGEFEMGTNDRHTYDNERKKHPAKVEDFELAKHPVTVYEWVEFMEDGGYQKPGLWSEAGWKWREDSNVTHPDYWFAYKSGEQPKTFGPLGVRKIGATEPVKGISLYEAEAYCMWSGTRLPTEEEWEYEASGGERRRWPWGDDTPTSDHACFGFQNWFPECVRGFEKGESRHGVRGMAGGVWEWTKSKFRPYPGFVAFPYEGYSKAHFNDQHYLCRGGSFATAATIMRNTFRNWYVPTYRQGFLGIRCAR